MYIKMQCTINITIQVWYYLKQFRSYIYIYIYIYIYTHSDTRDTLYYVQVGIQGVSHIKYNAINQVPCKRNNRHCVLQILKFFTNWEKSHIIWTSWTITWKWVKFHTKGTDNGCYVYKMLKFFTIWEKSHIILNKLNN